MVAQASQLEMDLHLLPTLLLLPVTVPPLPILLPLLHLLLLPLLLLLLRSTTMLLFQKNETAQ